MPCAYIAFEKSVALGRARNAVHTAINRWVFFARVHTSKNCGAKNPDPIAVSVVVNLCVHSSNNNHN